MRLHAVAVVLTLAACASGPKAVEASAHPEADARAVAEKYLTSVAGGADESGLDLLLGGATTNARLFSLENWTIVNVEAVRHEEADLAAAAAAVKEIDDASRDAIAQILGGGAATDGASVETLSPEAANALMAPTQANADRLKASNPVLSYVLRVGQPLFFNPKNPARALLAGDGAYVLDVHPYEIESKEGPRKVARRWRLAVLHFKSGANDTGWKVLPAADWNAE